jgi:hypothetical protein
MYEAQSTKLNVLNAQAFWIARRFWTMLIRRVASLGEFAMSLTCEIEVEGGCLKMRVHGTYKSRDETFRVMDRLKKEADTHGCPCALLNLIKAQGFTSDIDKFYLGEYAAQTFRGKLKVAVVFPAEGITKFGENVAVNRGAQLAVLATEVEAMRWLAQA